MPIDYVRRASKLQKKISKYITLFTEVRSSFKIYLQALVRWGSMLCNNSIWEQNNFPVSHVPSMKITKILKEIN